MFEKLSSYGTGDIYPYHMPGHKRRSFGRLPEELYKIDITEIDSFDNLHQPEDILCDLQHQAARLYGAEESFYLVNGSTCGVLSAVSSALPFGGRILMARNCHKSAYHAAYLRQLQVAYLYPPYLREYDIFDAIEPGQVRQALERMPDIGAVLIVSPTYEGRIADIRAIADIVHEKGIPLIVDEAHGAHLGLAEGFPPNSCQAGADLVIHSVHKTLPALTQTALLHVNGELVDRDVLRRFLRIYQTSSPSYPLMASIDNALQYVGKQNAEIFLRFRRCFETMHSGLAKCRHLKFLPLLEGKQDIGKLLISVKDAAITGRELYERLLRRYRLQPEMASVSFVLAMFTISDGEEAYRRMTEALLEIDEDLERTRAYAAEGGNAVLGLAGREPQPEEIPFAAAWDSPRNLVPLADSVGRRVGEFVNLYPPGVPLLVPGERMTEEMRADILRAVTQGLTVQGVKIPDRMQNKGESAILVSVLTDGK